MPRVINGRNRNTTAKAILLKPYNRPSTSLAADEKSKDELESPVSSPIDQKENTSKPPSKAKVEYNKPHLVALIVKASAPDWDKVSKQIGKTPTQCKDTWRKTISPALLAGKAWSTSGPGWDEGMKMKAVIEVVSSSKPDWAVLGNIMGGKTANQVKDVWRKVIFPRLKKGMTIE